MDVSIFAKRGLKRDSGSTTMVQRSPATGFSQSVETPSSRLQNTVNCFQFLVRLLPKVLGR